MDWKSGMAMDPSLIYCVSFKSNRRIAIGGKHRYQAWVDK